MSRAHQTRARLLALWLAGAVPLATMGAAAAMRAGELPSADALVVRDAWVRESTATRTASAGYLTIENPTDREVTLVSVTVQGARHAELHTVVQAGGQGGMRGVDGIPIPARSSVALAPGGTHIMLSDIDPPYRRGSTVRVTLTFDHQHTQTARAVVRPLGAMSAR